MEKKNLKWFENLRKYKDLYENQWKMTGGQSILFPYKSL